MVVVSLIVVGLLSRVVAGGIVGSSGRVCDGPAVVSIYNNIACTVKQLQRKVNELRCNWTNYWGNKWGKKMNYCVK